MKNHVTAREFRALSEGEQLRTIKGGGKQQREAKMQVRCVKWFRWQYPHWGRHLVYVPNELAHGRIMGAQRSEHVIDPRDMGLVSGVSDLLLLLPRGAFGGLCVELKTDTGKLSEQQISWGVSMLNSGYLWECVRDDYRFKQLVELYLKL